MIDIALMIILGRTLLDSNAINGGVIARKITLPVPKPFSIDPEFIAREDMVPQCAFGEKLTWIPAQDKYVCLPDMK